MVQNDELILIDMGKDSVGYPLIELLGSIKKADMIIKAV